MDTALQDLVYGVLFNMTASDPAMFVSIFALLIAVVVFACFRYFADSPFLRFSDSIFAGANSTGETGFN